MTVAKSLSSSPESPRVASPFMRMEEAEGDLPWQNLPKLGAYGACFAMALTYVALLYAPLVLRLRPPLSYTEFMLRRFASAAVASLLAFVLTAFLLLPKELDVEKVTLSSILHVYGLRRDHLLQAITVPLVLTALIYLGPLVNNISEYLCEEWRERELQCCPGIVEFAVVRIREWVISDFSTRWDIRAWRNYVMAPVTEELVFRACMIPLLLRGGFQPTSIIFFCPLFFSLAHLNHFWELYYQQKHEIFRAASVVGLQLIYTTIFGWYASFLFMRTGHLTAPLVAHIFCNFMGLPGLAYLRKGKVAVLIFIVGIASFFLMLVPATNPVIYTDGLPYCKNW